MNIAIFGASGRVGSVVLKNALQYGHHVNVLVRNPQNINQHQNVTIHKGDVLQKEDVEKVIESCDAVISCLGTDKNDTLSKSMPIIVEAMRKNHIERIVTVGTAGILQSRTSPTLYRFQSNESRRKRTRAAEDHLKAFLILQTTKLDWTIVCPTYLPDGTRKGGYRTEKDYLPEEGKSISIYDTGDFVFSQLESSSFLHSRVGICY
jgi:uncharacterized protein